MNIADTNDVIAALERLRAPAPAQLYERVLEAVGSESSRATDRYFTVESPIGPLLVSYSERGVTGCVPGDDPALLERRLGRLVTRADPREIPSRIARAVDRTLRTGRTGPLPLDLTALTEFQQAVLRKTSEIPPGEVRPYGWVAREIGRPGATRAVGSALGANPVPVLVPCHRVVRSDGSVGEYAFGRELKRGLLTEEGLDPDRLEAQASAGLRFVGSDTTRIFCFPTCRNAKRITPRHRVAFASQRDAEDHGYRSCKVCRPAA